MLCLHFSVYLEVGQDYIFQYSNLILYMYLALPKYKCLGDTFHIFAISILTIKYIIFLYKVHLFLCIY